MLEIISREEARIFGERFYFTGERCQRGHVAQRTTKNCVCVQCNSEDSARRRSPPSHRYSEVMLELLAEPRLDPDFAHLLKHSEQFGTLTLALEEV